jgi:triosephosphate isomerase
MDKQKRKPVIAGNWKMNCTPAETETLIRETIPLVRDAVCDVVFCVPYIDLLAAQTVTQGTNICVGAQNVHFAPKGAYTGEISAPQLTAAGVPYVIIGHSERRQYFGETDETVQSRVRAALEANLTVILCVGELLAQREQGITDEIVRLQTKIALGGVDATALSRVVIAYEPVWAIGTGLTATPAQAQAVCKTIRDLLAELYGQAAADAVVIQYGGSMNAKNAAQLLAQPDIDGGLIGGASLVPQDFASIVTACGEV